MANFIRMTDLDLKGKRVFIRADLNVPTDDNGEITDELVSPLRWSRCAPRSPLALR